MPTANITRALAPGHPLDILKLRRVAGPAYAHPLSDSDVERLWQVFSRDRCAGDGWLPVLEESLADWEIWLKS